MPELPEVETIVRNLRSEGFEGARLEEVQVRRESVLYAGMSPETFRKGVLDATWRRIDRRAKYIRVALDNDRILLIHLRMTGRFRLSTPEVPLTMDSHDRLILTFTDGRKLHFHDTRAFGRFRLMGSREESPLVRLGPEPLSPEFSVDWLEKALARRQRMLKPLLLDQGFLAGLGNIYVDEALWEAGLSPERRAHTLGKTETRRLHRAIRKVLRQGLKLGGTTLGSTDTNFFSVAGRRGNNTAHLRVFRRQGKSCRRCGTPIIRTRLAQRSTHWCPVCQPAGNLEKSPES